MERRRRDITPLTLDSLVQDVSSIGAPYVIAPILGLADFGIYVRAANAVSMILFGGLGALVGLLASKRISEPTSTQIG